MQELIIPSSNPAALKTLLMSALNTLLKVCSFFLKPECSLENIQKLSTSGTVEIEARENLRPTLNDGCRRGGKDGVVSSNL